MTKHKMYDTDSRSLADLFGLSPEDGMGWDKAELCQVLRHQLSALLVNDLSSVDPDIASKVRAWNRAGTTTLSTFGDVVVHPDPPIELLETVKEFSKACRRDAETSLPVEIATLLYYASIAKALLVHGKRISNLMDSEFREGLQWLLERPWVDPSSRAIARDALKVVGECADR